MSTETLEPEELDAIRAAIQQAQPSVPRTDTNPDAAPVALIADDRAAERGRPNGLRIASRWARGVERQLARMSGAKLALGVSGVEQLDGAVMRAETADSWLGRVSDGNHDGIVAVAGDVIESAVARLLGDSNAIGGSGRTPSALSRRLFEPVGAAIVAALIEAWQHELGVSLVAVAGAEPWRHAVRDNDLVLAVTVISPMPAGTIRLIARPEMLVAADAPTAASGIPAAAIETALGDVPIEVQAELGRVQLTVSELRALVPGQVLALDRLVDDPAIVTIGGVVKATARAIVQRGAIAIEIAALTRNKDPR